MAGSDPGAARRRVELTLLGQTLTIRTEAPPDHVRALARYVEDRVAVLRQSGVRDLMTALSLAALDITDELFRARDDKTREDDGVTARLRALIALLEQATPPGKA